MSAKEQAGSELNGSELNGSELNGSELNGSELNGMMLLGFTVTGAVKDGQGLTNVRIEQGELVAERNSFTLRGEALEGAFLQGLVRNGSTSPATTSTVVYRITDISSEVGHDPTNTGSTFLYQLERWESSTYSWVPACRSDADGVRAAIPLAAEWDQTGNRTDSSSMFTLACTAGVIAKCYRWGYRPWVTGYGDLATMHWTCTRLARADYCGNGVPFTYDGHLINVWDILPAPGPIEARGPAGTFDAGWNTGGAVCLSSATWTAVGNSISTMCPTKLTPPSQGGIPCNSMEEVLARYPSIQMFRELY